MTLKPTFPMIHLLSFIRTPVSDEQPSLLNSVPLIRTINWLSKPDDITTASSSSSVGSWETLPVNSVSLSVGVCVGGPAARRRQLSAVLQSSCGQTGSGQTGLGPVCGGRFAGWSIQWSPGGGPDSGPAGATPTQQVSLTCWPLILNVCKWPVCWLLMGACLSFLQ